MTGTSDLAAVYVLLIAALWTLLAYFAVQVIARLMYGQSGAKRRRMRQPSRQPRSRPRRPFDWEWDG